MADFWWDDSKLRKIGEAVAMKKLVRVGFMVEREAKRLAPVDTGRLRASISTNWTGSGMSHGEVLKKAGATILRTKKVKGRKTRLRTGKPVEGIGRSTEKFTVVVGTNVQYFGEIEFGKTGRTAQPFLRPAFKGVMRFVNREF